MSGSRVFVVRYQAGPYSGERTVTALDEDGAIAIVRFRIRKEMSLPMYSDSYRVVAGGTTISREAE